VTVEPEVSWPVEVEALAARLLGDLRTRLGGSHLAHAKRVAVAVAGTGTADEGLVAAALLHDVVEKTDTTVTELLAAVGDERVVQLVDALTHRPHESDDEYLGRCAASPETLLIKRCDLLDKFSADDATVSAEAAEQVRREARQRLELLERLAGPDQG
jgi:(p)ppGpp synthase/HD superfamily hydrolase